jgi:Phage capsid family
MFYKLSHRHFVIRPLEIMAMDLLTQGRVNKINELAQAVLADSQRRRLREGPGGGAYLGLSESEVRRYSLARAIQSRLDTPFDDPREGAFERECSEELAKRFELPIGSMAVPQDVLECRGLGFLIGASAPSEFSFMDALRQRSVVFQLGAQHLQGLRDDVAIPRQVTDQTLQWLAPTGSATASDPSLGQLSGTPRRACVITDVSEQLLRQSSADRILKAGLAAVMAVGIDAAAINGAGGVEPLGVLNSIGVGGLSGTSLAYAGLVGVQKTVAHATAILDPSTLGYVTTPAVAELLKTRQRFTGTDSPLWRGAVHQGEIEGVVAVSTRNMLTATAVYGDWSTVYVCEWGPLMLAADRGGTRFNVGLVGIRAQWFLDVIVTSPTSFVKITSIT